MSAGDGARPAAGPGAKVNLAEALARFDERWSPHVVAELNGQIVERSVLVTELVSARRGGGRAF